MGALLFGPEFSHEQFDWNFGFMFGLGFYGPIGSAFLGGWLGYRSRMSTEVAMNGQVRYFRKM